VKTNVAIAIAIAIAIVGGGLAGLSSPAQLLVAATKQH
jgi:hypothetical protein